MARKSKSKSKSKRSGRMLPVLHADAAGIDIGAEEIFVAVPPDRAAEPVQSFGTFTRDLHELADWLEACQVRTVAMESTGVYWIPLHQILETRGFEVFLVNAQHVKNVPGRKSDVSDCQWIQYLHSVGLLKTSFRPPDDISVIRSLWRHRESLVQMAAEHTMHMQKTLSQMNLQLHHVLSDITGRSGLAILDAIVAGERDPLTLASLCHSRVKSPREKVAKSLEGDYRSEHLFALRQSLIGYRFYQRLIAEVDVEVQLKMRDLPRAEQGPEQMPPRTKARYYERAGNEPAFDLKSELFRIAGVDLTDVPGISAITAHTIIMEVGPDVSRFRNASAFASWLGLCPEKQVSGGKVLSTRSRKVKNRAAIALRLGAHCLYHAKNYLGDFHRKMKWRLGGPEAVTATAHKLAQPTGGPPAAPLFHSAVYDAGSNRMIVFGGNNCFTQGAQYYSDTWILSNANGLGGSPSWNQLTFSGASPPARENHTSVYDPGTNTMIVFGGSNSTGLLNDVWVLSNANGVSGAPTWTQISPSGSPPSPRSGQTAVYDPLTNRMTIFGGNDATGYLNDVWVLSNANGRGGTPSWTQIPTIPSTRPPGVSESGAAFNPFVNEMLIFGGGNATPGGTNSVNVLTNASGPLLITTASLPNGAVGLPYSANPSIASGNGTDTWSISAGSLPPGLSLNSSTGAMTGTPTSAGSFPITLQVVDSSTPQQTATRAFNVTVSGPLAPNFQQYAIPTANSFPSAITPGPDGAMWFTERQGNKIGRIALSGVINEYSIPTTGSQPDGIVTGPDNALWFSEFAGKNIGRITTPGSMSEFSQGTANPNIPAGITSGPDGALWFVESGTSTIGRITTSGAVTQFQFPPTPGTSQIFPYGIAAGGDGALWFPDNGAAGKIGRLTTSGAGSEFSTPTANGILQAIVAGPDGALWFTEEDAGKIGRITTSGVVSEFSIPTPNSSPLGIVAGLDGALWFTESAAHKIGRITTAGLITEFDIPMAHLSATPEAIASSPDGTIWFLDEADNTVAKLLFVPQIGITCNLPAQGTVGTPYSGTCTGSGGTPPYSASIVRGSLPAGLAATVSGNTITVSGTPSAAGPFTFAVQVQDSSNPTQAAISAPTTIAIAPRPLPVTCNIPTQGVVGAQFSATCSASGGTQPYAYLLSSGTLPTGLTVNSSTGAISGTITAQGTFQFVVLAKDSSSPVLTATTALESITAVARVSLVISPAQPAQPVTVAVQPNQAVANQVSGTVSLGFCPSVGALPCPFTDPYLCFGTSSCTTSEPFTIAAGSPAGTPINLPQQIQPPSIAGTITVTLKVSGQPDAMSTIIVAPTQPMIEANSVTLMDMTNSGFLVELMAISPTLQVDSVTFTFTPTKGAQLNGSSSPLTVGPIDISPAL